MNRVFKQICLISLVFYFIPLVAVEKRVLSFEDAEIVFYESEKQDFEANNLIRDVRFNMLHGFEILDSTTSCSQVKPLALITASNINKNDYSGSFTDNEGLGLLNSKHYKEVEKIENALNIAPKDSLLSLNLLLSFDGIGFKDCMPSKLEYLQTNKYLEDSTYITHIALTNWESAKETFSSLMIQDLSSQDRFLFPIASQKHDRVLIMKKIRAEQRNLSKRSSGLLYALLPPIDKHSTVTSGVAKGKAISMEVKGFVKDSETTMLKSNCTKIDLNNSQKIDQVTKYQNGIKIVNLEKKLSFKSDHIFDLRQINGLEIYSSEATENQAIINYLCSALNLEACTAENVKLIHVRKRGEGFSSLNIKELGISENSIVIIYNQSRMPPDHSYLNIAQKFCRRGVEWYHLYNLKPTQAMIVCPQILNEFLVTPVEQILFSNVATDNLDSQMKTTKSKILTHLDLIVLPHNK